MTRLKTAKPWHMNRRARRRVPRFFKGRVYLVGFEPRALAWDEWTDLLSKAERAMHDRAFGRGP